VILKDITEQKLAEVSLRESEEKYRNLVERANYGITIVQDGTVRYANPALAKIWGGSVEDIVGRPFADFIDPSEIPNVEEHYQQRMANGDATPIYETVLRSRDGNKISAELNAGLITFQGKSADLIIIQDITERKAVEERLFSLIRFQREMLDTAATWIDMFDAGGNITFWNLAAERISGYSRNEVLGHAKIWEWLYPDPEYRDKMMADVTAIILRNEHVDNFETVVRCKDSRERVILWHSNNFIDKDGKILGGIGIGADVTESINAQLAFKESKQRLSDIIDFLPDAIMVIDKDGKIISWNQAIVAMTGVKAEDILGKSDYEYAVPFYGQRRPILVDLVLKSQKGFERAYDNLEIKDGTLTGEAYIPNLRGRQAYLFGTASALYDLKGNVVGAIESIRDITEYKRAEEAIKAERDRAEQYLNIAEVILVVLDAEARITLLNRKGYQVLGYEEDELMGRDWIKTCLRPQDHEAVHEVNRKIIAGEIELFEYYESYILNKKGEEHLIAWHTTIIKDGEGCIIGTLSSGEDITQRRKAEEKNLQLAAIVESSNDAIVGGLLDGTITNWNRGAERIYGYTEDEIIGQPVTHLVSPKCLDEVPQIIARLRQGEHIDHYESLSRRKDGAEFPVDLTLSLIYDTKGRMIGASSIVRDITERKRAEDELRWNAALLEAQVESSLDGILVVDGQGKRITTNQRLLTMLNVPRSTIEQENDEALLQYVVGRVKNPDQFLEKVMYLYHHQDETSRDEIEFKDGLVVDRYSSPVIGRDGKYYGRIWTFRDITERKRAEEGLKRTQSSIRIAMDLVKLVRWEYDVENDMFTFDDQFYSLYGTTAEREGGPLMSSRDYARKFIPVEDASIVAGEISKALATTDPNFTSQLEHRIIRADGTEGVIAVRFGIIKNSEGRTIRTYGANQDITDRKLAEEALRESRQRLANIVDFLPDATFAVNREGKVIAWNRAIEEMTGVSKDDMLDRGGYAYSVPFYGEPRPILIDLVFKDQEEIK
jgi:PAS domain S-box-containing protein